MLSYDREKVNCLMSQSLDPMTFEQYKVFLSRMDKVLEGILETAKTALMNRIDLWDEIATEIREKTASSDLIAC